MAGRRDERAVEETPGTGDRPKPATYKQVDYAVDLAIRARLRANPNMDYEQIEVLTEKLRGKCKAMDRNEIFRLIDEMKTAEWKAEKLKGEALLFISAD